MEYFRILSKELLFVPASALDKQHLEEDGVLFHRKLGDHLIHVTLPCGWSVHTEAEPADQEGWSAVLLDVHSKTVGRLDGKFTLHWIPPSQRKVINVVSVVSRTIPDPPEITLLRTYIRCLNMYKSCYHNGYDYSPLTGSQKSLAGERARDMCDLVDAVSMACPVFKRLCMCLHLPTDKDLIPDTQDGKWTLHHEENALFDFRSLMTHQSPFSYSTCSSLNSSLHSSSASTSFSSFSSSSSSSSSSSAAAAFSSASSSSSFASLISSSSLSSSSSSSYPFEYTTLSGQDLLKRALSSNRVCYDYIPFPYESWSFTGWWNTEIENASKEYKSYRICALVFFFFILLLLFMHATGIVNLKN